VLLISFVLCVGLAITIPWAIQQTLRYAYTGELVTLEAQQEGNLLVTCPGDQNPVSINGRKDNLCDGREGILVDTGTNTGQLTIHSRTTTSETLAFVQLTPGSRLTIQKARAPRFSSFSPQPHEVVMYLHGGRIRVNVPSPLERGVHLEVRTADALVKLAEGATWIEVSSQESQVVVREGQATVAALANSTSRQVGTGERVVVPKGDGVTDVMPAERNLIADSNFRQPISSSVWETYTKDIEIPDQPPGTVDPVTDEGIQVLELSRVGIGHAETGIEQKINRDITDFQSLYLHIKLRILEQDVPVCGTLGSECPVMVRIDYVDDSGETRSWLQGFYYLPDNNPDPNERNKDFCSTCSPRNPHIQTVSGVWFSFDSDNLISIFKEIGGEPVRLRSISIYASGHTYRAQVAEIELAGQE
jgi:hypothetical protein